MKRSPLLPLAWLLALLPCLVATAATSTRFLLPSPSEGVTLWWALSSARKIQPDQLPPSEKAAAIAMSCARNEREAAQLVVRSTRRREDIRLTCGPLAGPSAATIAVTNIELLQVGYVKVSQATDKSCVPGLYPDPLLPMTGPLTLEPDFSQSFWIRIFVPATASPGLYRGTVELQARGISARVPLELTVYDFTLPDRMTCTTAFGFSPGEVFRYHGLKTDADKRLVLEKYWADLAAHHVSPYDPTPLDHFQVTWPEVRPPRTTWDDWEGLRIVTNEVHSGRGALLVYDDQPGSNVTASYEPLISVPAKGLRFHGWCRTALAGQRFMISFNHFDANRQWMSGRNRDLGLVGTGRWQEVIETMEKFPAGAAFVKVNFRATKWTDAGEEIGLAWFDDLSLTDIGTGRELLPGGDFERSPRTDPVLPAAQLQARFDFQAWDRAMDRALQNYHFNSFQVHFPGLGGGTFHEIEGPSLLGFHESDPEYPLLLDSYGKQLEAHLRERGWLDQAFVYWFDEPSPEQYPFVMNGFAKLKRHAPGLTRMLTEQVEPGLVGGPNLWCPVSNEYNHDRAQERRAAGEKFWWYVCTGPKAPYTGLFIDHPAPEMRLWVWQTWQRGINGLLVWQMNYWTSSAAYPDRDQPQDPYADPMSWTSGYSTPAGQRRPWGNGDGRFIYPPPAAAREHPAAPVLDGPVDSIRWEQLRDGIEDYEYLCILREKLAQAKSRLSGADAATLAELLQVPLEITRSMTEFAPDGAPIEARRAAVAKAIEGLWKQSP